MTAQSPAYVTAWRFNMVKAKYVILFAALVLLVLAWKAINERPNRFTIRVISANSIDSRELDFSGEYIIINGKGETITRPVNSTTPAIFIGEGEIVSCSFQKKAVSGTLKVILFNFNNDELKEEKTSLANGTVNVSFK